MAYYFVTFFPPELLPPNCRDGLNRRERAPSGRGCHALALSCHRGSGGRRAPLLLPLFAFSKLGTSASPHQCGKLALNTGWRCAGGGIAEGICIFCAVPGTREDATSSALISQYASHYSRTYLTKLYLDDLFNC